MGQHPPERILPALKETLLNPKVLNLIKGSMWLVWLGSLAAAFFGHGWVASVGSVVFLVTAGAHIVEYFVYREVLARADGSMSHHFVQTLLYGLLHVGPVKSQVTENPGASNDG